MDDTVREALANDRLIDITTTGRKTGEPRRIEIMFMYDGQDMYLTGRPGRRGWYANLLAQPSFTVHLKQSLQRDIPALAHPIRGEAERRAFFEGVASRWPADQGEFEMDKWLARSPLVRVELLS
ncbi:MAG TPA: nitroreductase family deazaflavin-dependent oxidoreductase [Dehalococcoidia bacterium]|nr:nitroreductase family deazaflavin-dependent oxidoreductase [Dehalococcoidia bacterium]